MTNFFSWRSAFKKSEICSTTKLVLFCISTYMNDDGKGAFPSIKTLMADASLSNKAVIKHIKLAEKMGFLRVSKLGLAGQKWRQNNYEIAFPQPKNVVNEVHLDSSEGGEPQSKGGEPQGIKVVNEVHLDSSEGGEPQSKGGEPQGIKVVNEVHTITPVNSPKNSPLKSKPKSSSLAKIILEQEFELFWKAYPKKTGKQKSRDKFLKICTTPEHWAEIHTGVHKYADWCANEGQEAKYIKNPLTWLNGAHWEDELDFKPPPTGPAGASKGLSAFDRAVELTAGR